MREQAPSIRSAELRDIPRILELLRQVNNVHHDIRPDLFVENKTKYEADELAALLVKPDAAIFVAEEAGGQIAGYLFSFLREAKGPNLVPRRSLYIDDLCVDAAARGQGVGSRLLEHAKSYAKSLHCQDITLNVWCGNDSALRFYENSGFVPKSSIMQLGL